MDQPQTTVTQPTTQTEEVKSNPKPKSKHTILKSVGVVFLLVTLFFAGFGSALVLTGFPPAQNSTVVTTTTEEKPETDEDVVTSSIPAGFKEVKSEMCNFSTVIPNEANYAEQNGEYEWRISENNYGNSSEYSLNSSQVNIELGRKDGLGGNAYIPATVGVGCASVKGIDLREAFKLLEQDLEIFNKDIANEGLQSAYSIQGFSTMWGEESMIFLESSSIGKAINWLVVKNDMVYIVKLKVESEEEAIQEDARVVFDSLRF